jgi:S-adenosylmethionine hydrolase
LPIITLISDRKTDDFYLGILKGQILSACNHAHIIDLALNVGLHSIPKTAFILKNAYKKFPANTIHIIGVSGEFGKEGYFLCLYTHNQYFISADNGLLSLVFDTDEIEKIVRIHSVSTSEVLIPAISDFGRIACEIGLGKKLEEIGQITTDYKKLIGMNPVNGKDYILGNLIYSDSFGNAVSNISYSFFNETGNGRAFKIFAGSTGHVIKKLSNSYNEVEPGEILALFNSFELLEIAMNKGEIFTLMNFSTATKIRIEFYDNKNS